MKKINITITDYNKPLLAHMRKTGNFLPAYCGGRGSCGRCRVRFLHDMPEATPEDQTIFTPREIEEGWRLACMAYVEGDIDLLIEDCKEEEIQAADVPGTGGAPETGGVPGTGVDPGPEGVPETGDDSGPEGVPGTGDDPGPESVPGPEDAPVPEGVPEGNGRPEGVVNKGSAGAGGGRRERSDALAVDIGTTTIAVSLVDVFRKRIITTITGINHQRSYGTDVLTRIDAANRGEGEELRRLVVSDLDSMCSTLGAGRDIYKLTIPVYITGNTTMQHLLQGLSCEGLGTWPFTPVDISMHPYRNMTILPGISTYVGADIVSGILACGMDQREEISLLVDLGTNGEMAIGNRHRILVASTAAGPAFEGGNISCGMAGIPGAIDTVTIADGKARFTTIGGEKPAGLCGTGVLETIHELVREGIVDETGLLSEPYFDEGFPLAPETAPGILFTGRDIREVQLAKSAIRAGIEILLHSCGMDGDQVDRLYLAGGFGQRINTDKAIGIGMIPGEMKGRITAAGNTALYGTAMLAMNPSLAERFAHIIGISKEIQLANHKMFPDLYMEHMFFDQEELLAGQ